MANEAYYVFMLICIPLCSVEEVFLLNLLRESSKEFFHQFICHFDGVVQNLILEVLQEVGERDLMRSLGKDREGILGDIILDGWWDVKNTGKMAGKECTLLFYK